MTNEETKRKAGSGKLNYVIVGKGKKIVVRSGATGEIYTLDKAQTEDVLELVHARQKLGRDLTKLLRGKGFDLDLSNQGSVHIEEDES